MSEEMWMERAQTAEARITTIEQGLRSSIDRVKDFKKNFGVKERDNGAIVIDYDKFVENLGREAALELLQVIKEKYES